MGPPPAPPRFVDGERLPYLGRSYGLALWTAPAAPFALRRGRFELARGLDGEARAAVRGWYTARARGASNAGSRTSRRSWAPPRPRWSVRDLAGAAGAPATAARAPSTSTGSSCCSRREIIDYVVVHELSHLHAPDHGPGFWRRVESVLPDWKRRRAWLSGHGQRHVV